MPLRPPTSTLFPYTTLFRSLPTRGSVVGREEDQIPGADQLPADLDPGLDRERARRRAVGLPERRQAEEVRGEDRKSTRLNSSHGYISYAVFCLKKKNKKTNK